MKLVGALLAAVVFLGTACGSTVPNADVVGSAANDGTFDTGRETVISPDGSTGAPVAGSAAARSPGSGASVGDTTVGGPGVARGAAASAHPGVNATKIFIGLSRDRSADPAVSLGAAIPRPPTEQIQTALAKHLNDGGGLAGRQITLVYHDYNSSSKPYAQTQQEACARFTEDEPVFAALNAGTYGLQTEDTTYQECMAKHAVTTIGSAGTRGDEASYGRLPSMVDVSGLNYTRMARVYIDTLAARGFLTRSTRIGLLYVDRPDTNRAIDQMLEPRLGAHGLRLTEKFGYRQHQADGEAGQTVSDLSSAVLQFQEAEVDRVLFLEDTGGAGPLLFMRQAESQRYRPRYGFTSQQAAQGLQSTYPAEQQHGAVGVGWVPMLDVAPAGRTARTSSADRCNAIIEAAGIPPPENEVEEVQRLGLCEPFLFLDAAMRQLVADGSPLSTAAFLQAIDRLGSRYASTLAWYGNRFGPDQHDGAAAARYFTYVDACSCYRSSGGVIHVP